MIKRRRLAGCSQRRDQENFFPDRKKRKDVGGEQYNRKPRPE
jgi:hypothetical protein